MTHLPTETLTLESWTERGVNGRVVLFKIQACKDVLSLHAGDRVWELNDPELTFSFAPNDTAVTSEFAVCRAGKPEFKFRYLHVGRSLASKIDPTYDALDFEMDHKLMLVAEYALSPKWQTSYLQAKRGTTVRPDTPPIGPAE